jgi:hypothetical protein
MPKVSGTVATGPDTFMFKALVLESDTITFILVFVSISVLVVVHVVLLPLLI